MIADTAKLAKVLGLLGSVHDGEVVAAARQAERIRADAGLTWGEIIAPMPPNGQGNDYAAIVNELLKSHIDHLTDWEVDFLRSIRRVTHRLTDRQIAVVERVLRKVRVDRRYAA